MSLLVKAVLFCGLLQPVSTLRCFYCSQFDSQPCREEEKDCSSSETSCLAATATTTFTAGGITNASVKTCVVPPVCGGPISINLGFLRTTVAMECCSTDLCNTAPFPAPYKDTTPNGRQCFTCVDNNCTKKLNCLGNEDRCFHASVVFAEGQASTVKGCLSQYACTKGALTVLDATLNGEVRCCKGSLCNSAWHAGQQLFLLLVSLASIQLFF
ncbi:urokinase plasminogen activator surface receptor-like isoform X1 [Lepisosteus oculatus]|uniref:urokinase plasminogen activator surface receptor-like isoform X1 n=1 Tax=Lepisosteus oculatus TaxID=7918 RepID=UPI0037194D64